MGKFYVEEILAHRTRKNETEYYIKWVGFSHNENTWEKEADLRSSGLGPNIDKYKSANFGRKQPRIRRVKDSVGVVKPGYSSPTSTKVEQVVEGQRAQCTGKEGCKEGVGAEAV